jgi:hypothetical protein
MKLETRIRAFVEKKPHRWNTGDPAQSAAKCRVTHYYEGDHFGPFISVTIATDGMGWLNSDVIDGLKKITGAKEFCVGTCDDANWRDGVVLTLVLPKKKRRNR